MREASDRYAHSYIAGSDKDKKRYTEEMEKILSCSSNVYSTTNLRYHGTQTDAYSLNLLSDSDIINTMNDDCEQHVQSAALCLHS